MVSSRINWSPFYEFVVNAVKEAESPEKANIPANWCGGFKEGSVELSELGKNVAPGTAEKVAEVKAKLENGSLKVFDTSKFTVKGEARSKYGSKQTMDIRLPRWHRIHQRWLLSRIRIPFCSKL